MAIGTRRWLQAVAAAAILTPSAAAAAASYAATFLGSVSPKGINASGQVVATGYSVSVSSPGTYSVVIGVGGSADLGSFARDDQTEATAINDRGQVVGVSYPGYGGNRRVFLYDNRKLVDLGKVCGDGSRFTPAAINGSGTIVGTCTAVDNASVRQAFRLEHGTATPLGFDSTQRSEATDINAGGHIVGLVAPAGYATLSRAFLYDAGLLTDLGTKEGDAAVATAINASGQIALHSGRRAYLYSNGVLTDLGTIDPACGNCFYSTSAINAHGQVVGSVGYPTADFLTSRAWIYSGGVMRDLSSLIVPEGNWRIEHAVGINDEGQIAASGCGPSRCGAYLLSPVETTPRNYQGLWWSAPAGSESGWGINVAHQGDTLFATWFTYDASGKALWLSMTADRVAENFYAGTLYRTTGPALDAVPFAPNKVTRTPAGKATLEFGNANNGSFTFEVDGTLMTKSITRQVFGALPTCTYSTQPDFLHATNYQDLWWVEAGAESGWGINLVHQGDIIFATWFTYDVDGAPLWLSMTAAKTGPGTYGGQLIRTTGPAFNASSFHPESVTRNVVGTATLTFADGNAATFAYTVNGVSQVKAITRQLFAPPAGTVCQ